MISTGRPAQRSWTRQPRSSRPPTWWSRSRSRSRRNGASFARTRSSSPISTLRRIPRRPRGCSQSGCTAIAYETVTDAHGGLPLLAPMSEVAGRLAIEAAARRCESRQTARGKLIGGVPGVAPSRVAVIGGGVVGTHAARMAAGLGAEIVILDRSLPRLRVLDEMFLGARSHTLRDAGSDRGGGHRRGRRDWRGAGAGRQRAETRLPRACCPHEAPRGAGRRRDRPGGLLRDVAADDPSGADLSGRRDRALLRRQHAGRRAGHVEPRAQQCHAAVRPGAGRARASAR